MKLVSRICAVILLALALLIAVVEPRFDHMPAWLQWSRWMRWPFVVMWVWQGIQLWRLPFDLAHQRESWMRVLRPSRIFVREGRS